MSNNIEALQLKRDFIFRQIEDYKHSLAETDKELAALKAESEKPREFQISLGVAGNVIACKGKANELSHFMKDFHEKITVIEKKPIVINQSKANKMYSAWRDLLGPADSPSCLVAMLNAIGIEARAGDD